MKYILSLLFVFSFFTQLLAFQDQRSFAPVTITRKALVIGNGQYTHSGRLKNPVNDAEDMAATLVGLGFVVTKYININREKMEEAINVWGKSLQTDDVALFYYAGHGIEVGGQNYLLPVDANPQNESQIKHHAISVEIVTGWMAETHTKTNILLLDACRNNPLTRSWRSSGPQGGLGSMIAPNGTFIGFAASPGSVASDGSGRNGIYTEAILKNINKPNLTIDQIFNSVNAYVRKETEKSEKKQIPFKSSSLEDDFYFIKTLVPEPTPTPKPEIIKKPNFLPFEPPILLVKGGTFQMGSNNKKDQGASPAHQVKLSDFYIGRYEVTQSEWVAVMGENPSSFNDCSNCPVERVSWDDVQVYLEKLNKLTGKKYRLPTEAEWEYAARGGNVGSNYDYAGGRDLGMVGWVKENSEEKTHEIGQKKANDLGLYDMTGNIYEWCSDWYADYSSEKQENPVGPSSGTYKVLRGGCYISENLNSRLAFRYFLNSTNDYRFDYLGFRIALTP